MTRRAAKGRLGNHNKEAILTVFKRANPADCFRKAIPKVKVNETKVSQTQNTARQAKEPERSSGAVAFFSLFLFIFFSFFSIPNPVLALPASSPMPDA
jgi:hypothetical protein